MKRFFKILLWIAIAAVFVGTFIFLYKNSQPKIVTYDIVSPSVETIERSTVLTGKIEPRDEIEIKPQISGIISEINVEPGDIVHEGDVIAKIKVIPDDSQLNSARNRLDIAKLSLTQTESVFNRTKELYDKKYASREEYEQAETEYLKAREEVESAIDAMAIIKDGVSKYNAQSSNTLVRATITGQVLEVPVKVGSSVIQANTMNDGTTVAKVADMNNLIFKGKVDETEVGLLHQSMPIVITIGALPDVKYDGEIEYIAPKSSEENGSNTFEIKAAIKVGSDVELRAGYSANASVILQHAADVLTVPEGVLEWIGDSTYVYVLMAETPEQKFERKPIKTGLSDGVNIQVIEGVTDADRLRGNKQE